MRIYLVLKIHILDHNNYISFPGGSAVKNPSANARDIRDEVWMPELGRLPGGGNGKLLQYSCLENSMDRSLVGYSPWGCKESDMTEAN